MKKQFKDKTILITGGSGYIGGILTKELISCSPKAVRVFDKDEMGLFQVRQKYSNNQKIRYFLGDITNKDRINMACENVDIIFHTAALKHVYFCEYNPFEALQTNVIGTQNVVEAALRNNVEKVIFTSSDKAVNPSNVMGVTKLLAEKLVIAANYYKGSKNTIFSCVRFGNIFGSSGSVISTFYKQISNGFPVTLTDPKMTRFVLPIPNVIDLLFSVTKFTQGGEIFIPKMKSIKIVDLAEVMVEEYSPQVKTNIDKSNIIVIGKGPGEKTHEELLTQDEIEHTIELQDMLIILPEIQNGSAYNFERIQINANKYPSYNIFKKNNYNSEHAMKLSKKEILNLLKKINIMPG